MSVPFFTIVLFAFLFSHICLFIYKLVCSQKLVKRQVARSLDQRKWFSKYPTYSEFRREQGVEENGIKVGALIVPQSVCTFIISRLQKLEKLVKVSICVLLFLQKVIYISSLYLIHCCSSCSMLYTWLVRSTPVFFPNKMHLRSALLTTQPVRSENDVFVYYSLNV